MITEKIYYRAVVTADCLTDAVGGPNTVFGLLKNGLREWAGDNGYFVFSNPEVHVVLPEFDSPHYGSSVLVHVIARAVKVQSLEEACSSEPFSESL